MKISIKYLVLVKNNFKFENLEIWKIILIILNNTITLIVDNYPSRINSWSILMEFKMQFIMYNCILQQKITLNK